MRKKPHSELYRQLFAYLDQHGSIRACVAQPMETGIFRRDKIGRGHTGSIRYANVNGNVAFIPDDKSLPETTLWTLSKSVQIPALNHFLP